MGVIQGRLDGEFERLFREGTLAGLGEDQLLDRFARDRDGVAFATIVERHGPMVLGVCRQLLRDPNDVDDAFQATFLVLVRKASSLRRKDLLGNWLYGVAYRVALRARSLRHRGQVRGTASRGGDVGSLDEQAPDRSEPVAEAVLRSEERPLIHDEIRRLPRKYRDPVVLCYIEGLTHEEAAAKLGWPVGSVKGRLSRARDLLRSRLVRRGVAVSSAAMAAELVAPDLRASVPASLTQSTLKAALPFASGGPAGLSAAGPAATPSVTALTEGVIHAMRFSLVRSIAVPALVAGALATGGTVAAYQLGGGFGGPQPAEPAAAKAAARTAAKETSSPGESSARMVREILADMERNAGKMPVSPEEYDSWSERLVGIERAGANNQQDRIAAARRHLDRIHRMLDLLVKMDKDAAGQLKKAWFETIAKAEQTLKAVESPPAGAAAQAAAGPQPPAAGGPAPAPVPASPAGGQPPAAGEFGGGGGMEGGGFGGIDEEALQQSRIMIARLSAYIAVKDKNPRNVALLKKLDEPVTLHFPSETPLEEVLKRIKQATTSSDGKPMPIYVDPLGLQEADKTVASPVTIDLQDVPLKFSLRLALKQLGLAYCIRDGVLVISSVNGILNELRELQAEQAGADPSNPFGGMGGPGGGGMGGFGGMGGGMGGGMRGGGGMM
ncbi:ECF RNA polymerase sigma factor SigW [Aquisphaera giovannonii]|uniref:ECF RNA polymerase sigma factor SigW n=2 Tax=Aquisphaera giovannonii TaxID=406548 RepID=A0A5B9W372_9BACT|nr:ECF RNA polymerase sigma factor SigW [Aquisphaera giovannonii]